MSHVNSIVDNFATEQCTYCKRIGVDDRSISHWRHCTSSPGLIWQCTCQLISGFSRNASFEILPKHIQQCPKGVTALVAEYVLTAQDTPLLTATYHGFLDLTIQLWPGDNIDRQQTASALCIAASRGHEQTILTLMALGADINEQKENGDNVLTSACIHDQAEIVKFLVNSTDINLNHNRKSDGATPLLLACRKNAIECVRHLLTDEMLLLHLSIKNGRSPLFIACFYGHTELVRMLVEYSKAQTEPVACTHPLAKWTIYNQCDFKMYSPLYVAAQNGYSEIVEMLVLNGADFNHTDRRGRTALWIASLRGYIDVVRVLLSLRDIEVDRRDRSGVTPLWAACQKGADEVVQLLLNPPNGVPADVNLENIRGFSPLAIAACNGHLECMESLIRHQAVVNRPLIQGANPLFLASQNGHKEAVMMLLEHHADVDQMRASDGSTALMIATHNGHLEIVDILMDAKADPMVLGHDGFRAFDYAAMGETWSHLKIAQLLYYDVMERMSSKQIAEFVQSANDQHETTPLHLALLVGIEKLWPDVSWEEI